MKTSLSSLLISGSWLARVSTASPLNNLKGTDNGDARDAVVVPAVRAAGFRDAVTAHSIPMRKQNLAPSTTHPALQRRANVPARLRNVYDVYYIIDLEVGNQTIPVSVDTGSSDTWLVQEPYECVSFWWDGPGTVRSVHPSYYLPSPSFSFCFFLTKTKPPPFRVYRHPTAA
jgi:hypothetical protein